MFGKNPECWKYNKKGELRFCIRKGQKWTYYDSSGIQLDDIKNNDTVTIEKVDRPNQMVYFDHNGHHDYCHITNFTKDYFIHKK
jgi:hypothetical protein